MQELKDGHVCRRQTSARDKICESQLKVIIEHIELLEDEKTSSDDFDAFAGPSKVKIISFHAVMRK